MKNNFWIKGCLLLLLCCPLQGRAQYDSTAVEETAVAAKEQNAEETTAPFYEARKVPDSLVKDLKANKKLQYRDPEYKPQREYGWMERFIELLISSLSTIRIVVMVLLLAGLGWLLYRFMKSNGISFFRKPAAIEGLTEIQEEELHSAQEYEEKIKAAIAEGNTRQAIRWWYLYTLFQLAGREMIVAGREKTNNDYLRSMRSSPFYKKFAALTLDYEYIWYGGFDVSEENFRSINQEFRDFNNAIGKAS